MSSIVKPSGYSPFSEEELTELVRGIDPDTSEVRWWYAQTLDHMGLTETYPRNFSRLDESTSSSHCQKTSRYGLATCPASLKTSSGRNTSTN